MSRIIQFAFVLLAGLLLGGLTAWYSIQQSHGIGAIKIGKWTAWAFTGINEADPYTVARTTADSTVPLGAAEGLVFEAVEDNNGEALRLECNYTISGNTPTARLWTLSLYPALANSLDSDSAQTLERAHTNSDNVVRFADGTFRIFLNRAPSAGNWIKIAGKGNFRMSMRLYDTPVTANTGLYDPVMPTIRREGCEQ